VRRLKLKIMLTPALARRGTHGYHGNAHRDRLGLVDERVAILGHVELVEHDHRIGTAVPRRGKVAFDAACVEVAVEPADKEYGVDVDPPLTTTQSPTAGKSRALTASCRSLPLICAPGSFAPSSIVKSSRSSRKTRAG